MSRFTRLFGFMSLLLVAGFILVLGWTINPWSVKPRGLSGCANAFDLTAGDCRCCHGDNLADRHHLLVETQSLECLNCHQLLWNDTTQSYDPEVERDCLVCHPGSLADRHHLLVQHADYECLSCHVVLWNDETQSYYVDLPTDCQASDQPVTHHQLMELTPTNCTACHLANLADEHRENCDWCHQSASSTVQNAISTGDRDCLTCHQSPSPIHSMACETCHDTTKKKYQNPDADREHARHMRVLGCGTCHMVPVNPGLEPTGQYCVTCHGMPRAYDYTDVPDLHRLHVTGRRYQPYSCQMCHGQAIPQTTTTQCSVCHIDKVYDSDQLSQVHQTHNALFDCSNCHFDPKDFALADSTSSCLRCHEMRPYASVYDLHRNHLRQQATILGIQCWSCHLSNGVSARARSGGTCALCHDTSVPPPDPLSTDSKYAHTTHAGYPCWACHDMVVPVFPSIGQAVSAPAGYIAGTVTGQVGPDPGDIAGVHHVTIATQDGLHSTLTKRDGTYRLDYLAPGDHTLIASKTGYADVNQLVTVEVNKTSTADFVLTTLPNTGWISGTVTDENAAPILEATVSADDDPHYWTLSAADGTYTLGPVFEGTYLVTASKTGFHSDSQSVTVASQSYADFTLVTPGSEICTDGFDNDGDGQIDCADTDCNPECGPCRDRDGDGYSPDGGLCGPVDCDDDNPAINPGVAEVCDGIDNNCSGAVDEGVTTTYYQDADADTYGASGVSMQACTLPAGYVLDGSDCDDTNASVNPGAAEVCNGIDDNCVAGVDEGFDGDSDGYTTCQNDCDDTNPNINPGVSDATCNGIDDNCSGTPDEGYTPTPTSCGLGVCGSTGQIECQNGVEQDSCTPGSPTENPEATCGDGLDNDCDGQTDTADANCISTCPDNDGDGYAICDGSCNPGALLCGDCRDDDPTINPGAQEVCKDRKDNDCDGLKDKRDPEGCI